MAERPSALARVGLTSFQRWTPPSDPEVEQRLPEDFVAVRFYFRPSFPDTPANRELVQSVVGGIADHSPVVLLNAGLEIDDHSDVDPDSARAVRLLEGTSPAENLKIQALAIARARTFVGTYGGLSYLAPAYGVGSAAFATVPSSYNPTHLELALHAAAATGGWLAVLDRPAAALRPGLVST